MVDADGAPGGNNSLTAESLQVVAGEASEAQRLPCPVCGRPIAAGQEVVTSLGDVRRGALGVTVHARCFAAIGRAGLLDLMERAFQQRRPP